MILLLDTHTLIWALTDIQKLGKRAFVDISSNKNKIYVSDVSLLECAIKVRTGKLSLSLSFSEIDNYLEEANIQQLPFDGRAVEHYISMPGLSWKDPFDGAIIAQAISKRLTLVTGDHNILSSGLDNLRVVDAKR